MIIDTEFKNLIPKATDEEIKLLKECLMNEGCRDALITWNDILIDGHTRYEICTKNGIPFNTVAKEFESRDKVIEWIILNQFGRRNITSFQRAELVLRLKGLFAEKAKENQRKAGENSGSFCTQGPKAQVNTRQELAKIAHVSEGTIRKVEKIKEVATKKVVDNLRKGITNIKTEFNKIEPKKPSEIDTHDNKEIVIDRDGIIYTFEEGKLPFYNLDDKWHSKKRMNLKDGQQFKIVLIKHYGDNDTYKMID